MPYSTARWISSPDEKKLKTFIDENKMAVAEDRDGRPVFLPKGDWELRYARERNPTCASTRRANSGDLTERRRSVHRRARSLAVAPLHRRRT